MSIYNDTNKPPRQPLSFSALCALPGAVVTRDERRGIVTVTFRGDFAGQQDLTIDEVDAMQAAQEPQKGEQR